MPALDRLAGIQYVGIAGASQPCLDALLNLIQSRKRLSIVRIVTHSNRHAVIVTDSFDDQVAVKCGFSSGYGGGGPSALSRAIQILCALNVEIDECEVSEALLDRLDSSALTHLDLSDILAATAVRPSRWPDYVRDLHHKDTEDGSIWQEFAVTVPLALIDHRIIDLAVSFWDGPDSKLIDGYRRLEDTVRGRAFSKDYGVKLFQAAFLEKDSPLMWADVGESEKVGRAKLFMGAYGAHRNPRAHREIEMSRRELLSEFLLLNHLFLLERQAIAYPGSASLAAEAGFPSPK